MPTSQESLEGAIARIKPIPIPQYISYGDITRTTLNDITNAAKILNISVDSNQKDIKDAYRNLSKLLHPDMNTDSTPEVKEAAEGAFKALNNAHQLMIEKTNNNIQITEPSQADVSRAKPRQYQQPTSPPQPRKSSYIPTDIDATAKDAVLYTLSSLTKMTYETAIRCGFAPYRPGKNAFHNVEVSVTLQDGSEKSINGFITFYDQNTGIIKYRSAGMPGLPSLLANPHKFVERLLNRYREVELKLAVGSVPEIKKINHDLKIELERRVNDEIKMRATQQQAKSTKAQETTSKKAETSTTADFAKDSSASSDISTDTFTTPIMLSVETDDKSLTEELTKSIDSPLTTSFDSLDTIPAKDIAIEKLELAQAELEKAVKRQASPEEEAALAQKVMELWQAVYSTVNEYIIENEQSTSSPTLTQQGTMPVSDDTSAKDPRASRREERELRRLARQTEQGSTKSSSTHAVNDDTSAKDPRASRREERELRRLERQTPTEPGSTAPSHCRRSSSFTPAYDRMKGVTDTVENKLENPDSTKKAPKPK